jgi:DtxR family Mn-dependent transcriptional regulator
MELPEQAEPEGRFERLSALGLGSRGRVIGISSACRRAERRRLLDLGIVPGTVIAPEMVSPSGDPTAYRVRGAVIALRREQADLVHIEPMQSGAQA